MLIKVREGWIVEQKEGTGACMFDRTMSEKILGKRLWGDVIVLYRWYIVDRRGTERIYHGNWGGQEEFYRANECNSALYYLEWRVYSCSEYRKCMHS